MPDEVARIGALSNGSNGQRSLESASLHFEPGCKRERGASLWEWELLERRGEHLVSTHIPDFSKVY